MKRKKSYVRAPNLTGIRFGKLIVKSRHGSDKDRNSTWVCECDCGGQKIIAGKYLKRGNNKSCGCLHTHPKGQAILKMWYRAYKNGAAKRKLTFELTINQFNKMIKNDCTYCGRKPELRIHIHLNGGILMNGLDRVDSTQGYIVSNLVPCCKICNVMKSNLTLEDFLIHIKNIYKRNFECPINKIPL